MGLALARLVNGAPAAAYRSGGILIGMENMDLRRATEPDGWIRMIGVKEAEGALREAYARLRAGTSRPPVYNTPTGDAPNIIRCHSLDPEGMRLAFSMSGAIHWSSRSLPWAKREMLNTVTSGANNCFY